MSYLLKYGGLWILLSRHSDSNITRQSQFDHVTTANLVFLIPFSSSHLSCISKASLGRTPLSTCKHHISEKIDKLHVYSQKWVCVCGKEREREREVKNSNKHILLVLIFQHLLNSIKTSLCLFHLPSDGAWNLT
jgi:hypothetical protein